MQVYNPIKRQLSKTAGIKNSGNPVNSAQVGLILSVLVTLWSLPNWFESLYATSKLRQDAIRSFGYVGAAQGESQYIYWDTPLPGFGLREFPNGGAS